jgi:hypothetical protein
VILVHGEDQAANALREKLDGRNQFSIDYPDLFDSIEL